MISHNQPIIILFISYSDIGAYYI